MRHASDTHKVGIYSLDELSIFYTIGDVKDLDALDNTLLGIRRDKQAVASILEALESHACSSELIA